MDASLSHKNARQLCAYCFGKLIQPLSKYQCGSDELLTYNLKSLLFICAFILF